MAMEIVSSPSLDQSDETDPGPPGPTCIEDLKKISIRLGELWMERHRSDPSRDEWAQINADIFDQSNLLISGGLLFKNATIFDIEDRYLIETELSIALQIRKQGWFRRIGRQACHGEITYEEW
ncbi:TPA: hypothetical protein DDX46_02470 [Candidatus Saccharibacteria bacterium]|nr:MAG: hypothetical protein UW38_C0001G0314 [Candidatus Saccharibacteria bacterium GW2011_GWC2_44_17]MBH1956138.1 hypothetical protein [Candidatus Saccharibacteria bacterium]OGL23542.1 MAG: hypothetical protein A2791_01730 [Candidatus Saccharibacteria bacterium RIFCSPHIGHO2_01_FULL_46_30]OGL33208.1 MAG: hypothetical protein A3E20_01205 [Candidatus Saccharibacteria bacterium RIFCSPHIGHO2_12_FULL_47_16]MBH1972526.1 hypothetical protein [Candidatus Saccharibacteria bacterium]